MICTRCKWYDNGKKINCLPFHGNPNADVVFVGEAFGGEEANRYIKTGDPVPFVGKAGSKFDKLLSFANLKREDVAIFNVIRCYQKGNPTPTKSEMDACFPFTLRDINTINPKLLVAMGECPLYQLTGRSKVGNFVGKVIPSKKVNKNVFVTYHPAACLYDHNKWSTLARLFGKIPEILETGNIKIKNYKYKLIENRDELSDVVKLYKDSKLLYVDTESTGLDTQTDKLRLVQFSNGTEPIYLIEANILEECKDLLSVLFSKGIIGQAFSYDAKIIFNRLGIWLDDFEFDTCLAEYILTGMGDNDLDYLTGKYDPESFGYSEYIHEHGGAHKVKDKNELFQYGANDVGVMHKIRREQYKSLSKNNMLWLFENITMPCNRVLTKMSLRGVKYDLDHLYKTDKEYEEEGELAFHTALELDEVKECENYFNRKFNPRSSQMLSHLLFNLYKLTPFKMTKTDNPSTDSDSMSRFASEGNEYCKLMTKYRSIQTLRDGFLSGVVPKLYDGIAHTRYSLHATTTGRPASYDPNLLNIPAIKKVKKCLTARPGHVILDADLSQVEVRVAAMLSQDKTLIDACNADDKDFHCFIAAQINNYTYEEFYEKYKSDDNKFNTMRRNAKAISFGVLYGMSSFGLSKRLDMSVDEAEKFITKYFSGLPKLKRYMDGLVEQVIKYGYIDTYFGFRRRWKNHTEEDHGTHRESQNHPIQGTAWNLLQLSLIKIDKLLTKYNFKSACLMQVYDSVVVEAKEDEVKDVAAIMKECLTTIHLPYEKLNTVKLKTDVEIGENYGETEKYI